MKRWIVYFILLLLSLWIGLKIQADPGMVFIRYQHWSIETTLWFALLVFLVFWVVLHSIGAILEALIRLPKAISRYFDQRSRRRSQQEMLTGFSLLLEENGGLAEKYFVKAAKQKNLPFMNYLLAAQAAQIQKDEAHRIRYLEKAAQYAVDSDLKETLALFEVKQAMASGRDTVALSKLISLYEKRPRSPVVLKGLKQIYQKMEDWEALYPLLPRLKKILSPEEWEVLQNQVYEGLLREWVSQNKGLNGLLDLWKKIPTPCRSYPNILIAYLEGLLYYGVSNEAEKLLVSTIKRQYNKELIVYYASFKSEREDKQIGLLESMRAKYPDDPELLFYLGRWYAQHRLWGKAEDYLTESLAMDPHLDKARFELGDVFLQLGNRQRALEIWSRLGKSLSDR